MLIKLALSLAIGSTVISASAQSTDIKANTRNSAYLQNNDGTIVRSTYGLCWRMGTWLAADAVLGCDGELTPPIAKPTAPAVATPLAHTDTRSVPPEYKRCDFTTILESDQTFPFNSATLTKAAKNKVNQDVLSQLANCSNVESVQITGYTDLLGSKKHNQQLSEKRAANLAVYLKNKNSSLPVNTRGAGSTDPVKICDTKLPRKKLIQCLAPNRRLVIAVKGQS